MDAVRPGAAPTRPLVDEYLQKLEQLQRAAKPGSDERRDLTDMLAYAYCLASQLDRAQDLLEAALAELRAAGRSLPSSGETTLDQ